jgi:hypothetical protein
LHSTRVNELEAALRERLKALSAAARAELLHVPRLSGCDRTETVRRF